MRTRFLAVAHGLRGLDLWLKVQTAVVKSGEVVFGFLDRYVWPLKQTDTVHQQTIRVAPTKPTSSPLPQDIMTYCTYSTVTTPFLPGPSQNAVFGSEAHGQNHVTTSFPYRKAKARKG